MKSNGLITLVFILTSISISAQSLKDAWSTNAVLKVPESVLFGQGSNLCYISSINGKPAEKNGEGFISIMDRQGKIVDLKWATGLNAPKGMDLKDDKLFVSDIDRVAVIDTRTGKIIKYIDVPGSVFLNDVATGPDGNVYVTDTRQGVVYVLKNDKPEIWSKDPKLKGANGIIVENGHLLIGSQGYLLKGNTSTKELTVVAEVPVQIDGLVPVGEAQYVISAWTGKILFIYPDGSNKELFDSKPMGFHTADMGYLPDEQLLLIPTFTDRVIAKKIILP